MLPFLKRQQEASSSGPVEVETREPDDGSDFDAMESAAEDLIKAVHAKDVKAVSAALKAAFEIYDSEPHEEGPHE